MAIIQARGLTRKFGSIEAVSNVDFEVTKGEIFAFLGPNGAGKSTTIRMLTTLLRPTSGNIIINGIDPVADPSAARHSFGIVFQDPSLDDELTARENLELHGVLYGVPRTLRRERITQLLTFVELGERADDVVKSFSGGMKRRLEIARGLLHHPAVLFLDEPTLGLDPQTRNHLWSYLERLNQTEGMTVFFTTHYLEEAQKMARTVAIIDQGRIVARGSPAELIQRTGTASLEEAYLKLTGSALREESGGGIQGLRQNRRLWARR
ncbi:MAG TPA: ATP-binding cassette domain-containing protein [Candidatus Paceibacterota bacterium]|nr:ATP-binding cassette domain-containing protein [Candidatus Paceibacterota bacterium]